MLAACARELAFLRRSPWDLCVAFVFPIVAIVVTLWIFSSGTPRHVPIAVVDQDGSVLSRTILRDIGAISGVNVAYRPASFGEALSLVRQGNAYAIVLIPHATERNVLRGRQGRIVAYTNAMYALPAGTIGRELQAVVAGASARAAVVMRAKRGIPLAEGIAQTIPISVDLVSLYNERTNYEAFLADALVPALLLLLLVLATVSSFGRELRDGTAGDWLACAGGNTVAAIAGKALPYFLAWCIFGCGSTVYLAARNGWQHGFWTVLLGTVLVVAAYLGLSLAIVGVCANFRLALSVASVVASPAFAYAGVSFPQRNMVPLARWWSEAAPLTWYLRLRIQQFQFGAAPAAATLELAALAAVAICGGGLGLLTLGSLARAPETWFKR
jgi:ABC-2 type transport system permease protein